MQIFPLLFGVITLHVSDARTHNIQNSNITLLHLTNTARDRPYNKCTRTLKISQSEAGTTTLYIAHPFTATHCAHHQAFKPIEPWNNIVHTAIDSYTGFIISRTHDKHQWLLLQFIILLMMDANCIRNMWTSNTK